MKNVLSEPLETIKYGITKWSDLGPVLFSLYVSGVNKITQDHGQ